jgi:hypothetical protein
VAIPLLLDLGVYARFAAALPLLIVGRGTVVRLAVVLIFPLLPLALTMVPLDQIITRLIKLVF